MRGESGRNELLRGPFALFGVRIGAKLVRDLAKHRRTPMSPPQLIPPTSPGQVFAGAGRLRQRFSRHRTWSVPGADCLQPSMGRALSRLLRVAAGRYHIFRNSLKRRIEGISYLAYPVALSVRDKVRPPPHTTTILPQDERLIYTPYQPVRWPYRRRPHLLNEMT